MRRRLLVLLAMVAMVGLGACGGGDDGGDAEDGGGSAGGAEHVITIKGSAFSGVETVPDGSSVTIENEDGFEHTFTPDKDGDFEPASLDGGASATVEMPGPGTYGYHCEIHTSMTGEITVEAGS